VRERRDLPAVRLHLLRLHAAAAPPRADAGRERRPALAQRRAAGQRPATQRIAPAR
jgi:hypothetical protein